MEREILKINLYNVRGKLTWRLMIVPVEDEYHVHENVQYSLFPGPLATGKTKGEAFENFLAKRKELLNGL